MYIECTLTILDTGKQTTATIYLVSKTNKTTSLDVIYQQRETI